MIKSMCGGYKINKTMQQSLVGDSSSIIVRPLLRITTMGGAHRSGLSDGAASEMR